MDDRTRREKLQAMAAQSASPREAAIARQKLASTSPRRTLSRDDIMAAPDLRAFVRARRVYDPSLRVVVVMDDDDPAWASPFDLDGAE